MDLNIHEACDSNEVKAKAKHVSKHMQNQMIDRRWNQQNNAVHFLFIYFSE